MSGESGRVRWGILGCGAIATSAIAPAIRWSQNGELVAIGSRTPERAQARADEIGAPRAHGSYEALLDDPGIDAIYIGTPNGTHARWVAAAAAAGKHVLCDKSLALSAEDAAAARDACRARGVRLVEGFMYRHHPQWDVARRLLRDGAIGKVQAVRAWLAGTLANPDDHRFSRELGGGALFDVTCYAVNAVRLVTSEEPGRVLASARWLSPGVDASTHALLELPGGAVASVHGSLRSPAEQGVIVVGERGRIVLEKPFVPHWDPVQVVLESAGQTELLPVPGANHFLHMVEHVGRMILDPSADLGPAEDGVANVTACAAIAAAAAA